MGCGATVRSHKIVWKHWRKKSKLKEVVSRPDSKKTKFRQKKASRRRRWREWLPLPLKIARFSQFSAKKFITTNFWTHCMLTKIEVDSVWGIWWIIVITVSLARRKCRSSSAERESCWRSFMRLITRGCSRRLGWISIGCESIDLPCWINYNFENDATLLFF